MNLKKVPMDQQFLKASLLRALKGVDTAPFQKVTVLLKDEGGLVTFYVSAKPDEELLEIVSEIESEMLADLSENEHTKLSFKVVHFENKFIFASEIVIFP